MEPASPGVVLSCALSAMTVAGTAYWAPSLSAALGATLALPPAARAVFAAAFSAGLLPSVAAGLLHARVGPRRAAALGGAGLAAAYAVLALVVHTRPPSPLRILIPVAFSISLSSYLVFASSTSAANAAFPPAARGRVTGLLSSVFAMSSGLFGAMQAAFFPRAATDPPSLVRLLTFVSAACVVPVVMSPAFPQRLSSSRVSGALDAHRGKYGSVAGVPPAPLEDPSASMSIRVGYIVAVAIASVLQAAALVDWRGGLRLAPGLRAEVLLAVTLLALLPAMGTPALYALSARRAEQKCGRHLEDIEADLVRDPKRAPAVDLSDDDWSSAASSSDSSFASNSADSSSPASSAYSSSVASSADLKAGAEAASSAVAPAAGVGVRTKTSSSSTATPLVPSAAAAHLSLSDLAVNDRFWYMFGMLACVAGCGGFTLINTAEALVAAQVLAGETPGSEVSAADATADTVVRGVRAIVVLFSAANVAGRLAVGAVMDSPRTLTLQPSATSPVRWRYSLIQLNAVLVAVGMGLCTVASSWWLLVTAGLVGFGHGANFSMSPALSQDFFGVETFARDFALAGIGAGVGATLLAGLASVVLSRELAHGSWVDVQAGKHKAGLTRYCVGASCYRSTYIMCVMVLGIFVLRSIWLKRRLLSNL